jgi:hypothetical protein
MTEITELLRRARSRAGLDSWQISSLANLRGIDPSSPLSVIFAADPVAERARLREGERL